MILKLHGFQILEKARRRYLFIQIDKWYKIQDVYLHQQRFITVVIYYKCIFHFCCEGILTKYSVILQRNQFNAIYLGHNFHKYQRYQISDILLDFLVIFISLTLNVLDLAISYSLCQDMLSLITYFNFLNTHDINYRNIVLE